MSEDCKECRVLRAQIERLGEELDEAREAARWMAECDPSEYELKRWPWLEDEKARES